MFTDVEPVGREKFVLSPFDMSALSDEIEGCQNPVGASPAAPVDHILKDMAGIPANQISPRSSSVSTTDDIRAIPPGA
ncbi:MAG: hypothetical protein II855_02310 [Candidatus Methanomethylophilaceae archaeon]|nr:hypothetical protein [Candidatus Methanomethylophilaceae archaeon]